jgi:hypothetical protein
MLTEWLQGQEHLEDGVCISSNQNRNAYPKPAILRSIPKHQSQGSLKLDNQK